MFDVILSIASSNSYETTIEQTKQQTKIIITHMKKLVFVLKKGAGEQVKEFLERTFLNQGTAKIVVDRDNPVVVTFKNKSQTVHFRANFGFWNNCGVTQH